ncbi:hypothetical protein DXB18_12380 [Clostridium sp. OM02-18AC]|uniref:hypothetical protein n=1 Tax=Clostridium sp. OM02-18AC TaxID=2292311 RepID=UPI000E476EEB|nr:hypothetical protein [Clostridium sp. OM02-18AC]RHV64204.1 hypothetical protein DXB18_12380 [Clostridium sp. OM02-18AC]
MKECNGTGLVLKICETKNDVWKKCGLSIQNSIDNYIKITKIKLDSASLNNGQNAGDADKMGISGVVLCWLALKWL